MLVKKELEKKIKKIMYEGAYDAMLATFTAPQSDDMQENTINLVDAFAEAFTKTVSSSLTDAIDEYVKSASINLSMCTSSQSLVVAASGAMGPVTGTATGPLSGTIDGKTTPGAIS